MQTAATVERAIDAMPAAEALAEMAASQAAAAQAVALSVSALSEAAELVARTLEGGHKLVYAAAGSSALMALSDAAELPGTFRIPQSQISIHMAGGVPVDGRMPGGIEDSTREAAAIAAEMGPQDTMIVVSASGTTPFACAAAEAARGVGSKVIAIANVPKARLLELANVPVAIPTAAEVVAGSTRLGAGTAQKIALNMISTQAGILLGHVHEGLMVNLFADNAKLRARAVGIVARIAGVAEHEAQAALDATGYEVKPAVLVARGDTSDAAQKKLAEARGQLRELVPSG